MDLGLKGKRAFVNGASRGIGRAIVTTLANEGVDIAFCARGEAGVVETASALTDLGVRAFGKAVDIRTPDYLSWLDEATAMLGGLDIFVHNVTAHTSPDSPDPHWDEMYELNVMAAVRSCESVVSALRQSQAGAIVLISTGSTRIASSPPGARAYGATKAALASYGAQLSQELAPEGIRVNVVSPGSIYFEGGFWDEIKTNAPKMYEAVQNSIPIGRYGTPEEVANLVTFVASPAASLLVGSNVHINGGQLKQVEY